MSGLTTDIHAVDVVQQERIARERFIRERTAMEQEVDKFMRMLSVAPKDIILDKIPFDYSDWSLQTLVPEYYKELPNQEIADAQIDAANEKLAIIISIYAEANMQAYQKMLEFNSANFGR